MAVEPKKDAQEEIKDLPEPGGPLSSEDLENVLGGASAGSGLTHPGSGFSHQCLVGNVLTQD